VLGFFRSLGEDGSKPALVEPLELLRGDRLADPARCLGADIGRDQRLLDVVERRVSSAARLVRPVRLSASLSAVLESRREAGRASSCPGPGKQSPSRPVIRTRPVSPRARRPQSARKASLWPLPLIFDQHRLERADQAVEPALFARAAASREAVRPGPSPPPRRAAAFAPRACPAAARRERHGRNDIAIVEQFQAVYAISSVSVGNPGDQVGADRRIGPRGLDPLDRPPHRPGCGGASCA
jgi:hypothetical protein